MEGEDKALWTQGGMPVAAPGCCLVPPPQKRCLSSTFHITPEGEGMGCWVLTVSLVSQHRNPQGDLALRAFPPPSFVPSCLLSPFLFTGCLGQFLSVSFSYLQPPWANVGPATQPGEWLLSRPTLPWSCLACCQAGKQAAASFW
jgi:hypothetical protein